MTTENIARNLRYLCERKQSISLVCRQLGINRQQFGRYLNGENRPSIYNLTKICQHFKVSIDDIVLPHVQFRERLSQSSSGSSLSFLPDGIAAELMKVMEATSTELDSYLGHYFRYHCSFAFPGYIFKSFFTIQKVGKFYCTKHIERVPRKNTPIDTSLVIKYNGIMTASSSRFFLIERMTAVQNAISHTIYAPIPRPGRRYLSGVGCSLSTNAENHPAAARSVLEYVGPNANIRAMLSSCGLFKPDSSALTPYILSLVDNRNDNGCSALKAHCG